MPLVCGLLGARGMVGSDVRGPRLLERLRSELRVRHYSVRTEEAYVAWVRRFVRFHGLKHPAQLGSEAISVFLTHLATVDRVAAPTQGQALAALLFLYTQVLKRRQEELGHFVRARRPRRVPNVLTADEVTDVLQRMSGMPRCVGVRAREDEAHPLRVCKTACQRARSSLVTQACSPRIMRERDSAPSRARTR